MLPNVAGASRRRLECHDASSMRALVERNPLGGGNDPLGGNSPLGGISPLGGCSGWTYVVERSPSGVPKPGWIAHRPGASCTFTYGLSLSAHVPHLSH